MNKDTVKDIMDCQASGWTMHEAYEELIGGDVRFCDIARVYELGARAVHDHMNFTIDLIIECIVHYRTPDVWADDLGMNRRTLTSNLDLWLNLNTRKAERIELALALMERGVGGRTVQGVVGHAAFRDARRPIEPPPPYCSREDRKADALFLKTHGHM